MLLTASEVSYEQAVEWMVEFGIDDQVFEPFFIKYSGSAEPPKSRFRKPIVRELKSCGYEHDVEIWYRVTQHGCHGDMLITTEELA